MPSGGGRPRARGEVREERPRDESGGGRAGAELGRAAGRALPPPLRRSPSPAPAPPPPVRPGLAAPPAEPGSRQRRPEVSQPCPAALGGRRAPSRGPERRFSPHRSCRGSLRSEPLRAGCRRGARSGTGAVLPASFRLCSGHGIMLRAAGSLGAVSKAAEQVSTQRGKGCSVPSYSSWTALHTLLSRGCVRWRPTASTVVLA